MKTRILPANSFITSVGKCIFPLLVAYLWPVAAHAAQTQVSTEPFKAKPEEIVIFGKRSIDLMRQKQKQMFELYNSLNSDDDNDVFCDFDGSLGSRMKHWDCDIVFMRKERQKDFEVYQFEYWAASASTSAAGAILPSPSRPRTNAQLRVEMKDKIENVFDEMRELSKAHPELGKLVSDYTKQMNKVNEESVFKRK